MSLEIAYLIAVKKFLSLMNWGGTPVDFNMSCRHGTKSEETKVSKELGGAIQK